MPHLLEHFQFGGVAKWEQTKIDFQISYDDSSYLEPNWFIIQFEQFDIDLASPEAQLLEKFWLHIFQQKNKNQQDAIQSISELESAIGNGGNWHVVGAKALAVGIDLSDLGVPEGQTVDGIFLQDALDNQDIVDPVFIAGFPPLKHTTEK